MGQKAETGTYQPVKDRWHTRSVDLSGFEELLGQVEGRTAYDASYRPAQATPA